MRLFSFGGYGSALAALALVVFGAYDSYPIQSKDERTDKSLVASGLHSAGCNKLRSLEKLSFFLATQLLKTKKFRDWLLYRRFPSDKAESTFSIARDSSYFGTDERSLSIPTSRFHPPWNKESLSAPAPKGVHSVMPLTMG